MPSTPKTAATNGPPKRSPGQRARRPRRRVGTLLVIGGSEDRQGQAIILRALCRLVGRGKLAVITVASGSPEEQWMSYSAAFTRLGLGQVVHVAIADRDDASRPDTVRKLQDVRTVFFTGGDQLRITSMLGDTPVWHRVREIFTSGGTIAGTSAGASIMSELMIASGSGAKSYRIGSGLQLAPGLGFLRGVVVDQHFAERGRIGRLLGIVAHNPRMVGIGIDENTAILVDGSTLTVIGAGAVYIVDGRDVTHTNVSDERSDRTLSLFGVKLHVLSQGDEFSLDTHEPVAHPAEDIERRFEAEVARALETREAIDVKAGKAEG